MVGGCWTRRRLFRLKSSASLVTVWTAVRRVGIIGPYFQLLVGTGYYAAIHAGDIILRSRQAYVVRGRCNLCIAFTAWRARNSLGASVAWWLRHGKKFKPWIAIKIIWIVYHSLDKYIQAVCSLWQKTPQADHGGRSVQVDGLRPIACWGCGFESYRGCMDICLFWVLRLVRQRYLRLTDHSSKRVLPSVVCLSEI